MFYIGLTDMRVMSDSDINLCVKIKHGNEGTIILY